MTVKLDVSGNLPPGQSMTVTLLADGPGNLDGTTTFIVTGSNTVEKIVTLTTAGTLSNMVYKATPTFAWKLVCGTGTNSAGSTGPHTICVTYGMPLSPPFQDGYGNLYNPLYDFALEKACGYVNGDTNIVSKIASGIDGNVNYDPSFLLPPGHPLTAYSSASGGLCADLSYLLRGLMRSIGIAGTVTFYWGGLDNTTMYRYKVGSTGEDIVTFRVLRAAHDSAPLNPHFSYHAVVPYAGVLYDPSYGISYTTLVFDETAFGTTSQQFSSTFPSFAVQSGWVCPH